MNNSDNVKILIVDDEEIVRINLVAFFEDEGFEVLSVESGEAALELLASESPDVGIIDIRLPGMNGDELIQKIALLRSDMKFLIYTGSIDFKLKPVLLEIGITENELFRKPLMDMGILSDAVRRILSR